MKANENEIVFDRLNPNNLKARQDNNKVALIIGGIGLATGVIDATIFGVTIVMTIVTTILAPILLNQAYKDKK